MNAKKPMSTSAYPKISDETFDYKDEKSKQQASSGQQEKLESQNTEVSHQDAI